jgi:hypothetical protein
MLHYSTIRRSYERCLDDAMQLCHSIVRETWDVITVGRHLCNKTKSKNWELNTSLIMKSRLFPLFLLIFSLVWTMTIECLHKLCHGKHPQAAGSNCDQKGSMTVEDDAVGPTMWGKLLYVGSLFCLCILRSKTLPLQYKMWRGWDLINKNFMYNRQQEAPLRISMGIFTFAHQVFFVV